MFHALSHPSVFTPVLVLFALAIYKLRKTSRLSRLPLLNSRDGEWFSHLRTKWRNTFELKDALSLANSQHKDDTMLLTVMGQNDMVLLPNYEASWIMKQPSDILSRHEQTNEELAIDYGTYFDKKVVYEHTVNHIITAKLNGQIGNLVPIVVEELNNNISHVLGTDTKEFKEICVYETLKEVECQVSGRVFCGLPACRDPDLPKATMGFVQAFPLSGVTLGLIPKPLKTLVAPLVTLPNRKYEKAFIRILRPDIEQRLNEYRQRQAGDPEKAVLDPEHIDFLQWTIQYAMKSGDPHLCTVETIAGIQLLLNFASIHTSSFAITHVILDLASSKQEYIDGLREEIATVLAEHGDTWGKQALSKMAKLDSTMRESQRINMISPVGVLRRVAAKGGVTTPSGVHVPKGVTVAVNAYSIHHDPKLYGSDADEFKPFRFAEKRADESVEYVERARQAWATTSADYMAFGGGRSACPGRFFGSAKVKLMLAHLLMNYDFEMLDKRPENLVIGVNVVPPMKATIRIRRRENGAGS